MRRIDGNREHAATVDCGDDCTLVRKQKAAGNERVRSKLLDQLQSRGLLRGQCAVLGTWMRKGRLPFFLAALTRRFR